MFCFKKYSVSDHKPVHHYLLWFYKVRKLLLPWPDNNRAANPDQRSEILLLKEISVFCTIIISEMRFNTRNKFLKGVIIKLKP